MRAMQRRKKRTRPPPKEDLLGNFSGLRGETFRAGGGYKNPNKNQENHIHHRNLSRVDPILFCKEQFCTGAGRYMVSFSQLLEGTPLKPYHFNRTLDAQKVSSEHCQTSTAKHRAELKVTHLRWRSPICGFLRFSAKICGFLRKSAVFCGFLRPPNAGISRRRGESAKICGFLRKSAFWALSVTLVLSP